MAKKNGSWELFDKAKKDLRIRAIKDPRKKDAYILTFEDKLGKKDSRNVLDMCGEILGKEIGEAGEKLVAQVRCRGGVDSAEYKYEYTGVQDCNAAVALYGGPKVCPHGCLGFGSCIKVCPVDAIFRDDQNLVRVDRNMCISCGKCVDVCPTGVMQMIPYRADVFVACNSTDKGGAVRKYCSVGCIGCKICVKKSPEGGFEVVDFLARIDYDQDGDREQARDACPTKCIVRLTEDEPEAAEPAVSQAAHVED